jgi:hypothetical protein
MNYLILIYNLVLRLYKFQIAALFDKDYILLVEKCNREFLLIRSLPLITVLKTTGER